MQNNPVGRIDPSGHIDCEVLGTEDCEDGDYVDYVEPTGTPEQLYNAGTAMLQRLEEEGLIASGWQITSQWRSLEDAHRFSTAYMITSGNADADLLQAVPIDLDGNVWFRNPDWLYNDRQCILAEYRCGATKFNAAVNSPETQIGSECDDYSCYPTLSFALEGYPVGDPRRLPNTNDLPVSNHIMGLAIDIQVVWLVDPWNSQIDQIASEFGLYRPFHPNTLTVEQLELGYLAEHWHFEFLPMEN